jgi:hypothetical protein
MFLRGPCRDIISYGESQLLVEFCKGGYEPGESRLLEALAQEQLVQTQEAGK